METALYIRSKNKLVKSFNFLHKLKHWLIIEAKDTDKWLVYEKGELLIRIECEFIIDSIIFKISKPIVEEVSKADEILLIPLLLEKDIRDIINTDKIILKDDNIYLYKILNLKLNAKNSNVIILNQINDLINSFDKLTTAFQSKLDYILQIKLN